MFTSQKMRNYFEAVFGVFRQSIPQKKVYLRKKYTVEKSIPQKKVYLRKKYTSEKSIPHKKVYLRKPLFAFLDDVNITKNAIIFRGRFWRF